MVTYDFYQNSYLGSAIPERAFSGVAARAEAHLQRLKSIYRVAPADEVSQNMALCAVAEAVYSFSGREGGLAATSVGGVSVRYQNTQTEKLLNRAILENARIYLDIYRGVTQQ